MYDIKKCEKIKDVALEQIKNAAQLYEQGNYASSIVLSGAAEELLGKIAKKKTGYNEFGKEEKYIESIYEYFKKPIPNKKEIRNKINKTKNKLKHNDSGKNYQIDDDLENEAVLLFVKAVKNYHNIYNKMPNNKIIINLFEDLTN